MSTVDVFAWCCIAGSIGVFCGALFIIANFDVRPRSKRVRDEG